jgi:hypothetical protein
VCRAQPRASHGRGRRGNQDGTARARLASGGDTGSPFSKTAVASSDRSRPGVDVPYPSPRGRARGHRLASWCGRPGVRTVGTDRNAATVGSSSGFAVHASGFRLLPCHLWQSSCLEKEKEMAGRVPSASLSRT